MMLEDDVLTEIRNTKFPSDFGTTDEQAYLTHYPVIGITRDSDILAQSNYAVISKDLMEKFPDDVYEMHGGHWAHGHFTALYVRALSDEYVENTDNDASQYSDSWRKRIQEEDLHPAIIAAGEWMSVVQQYAIVDEGHFSEMEEEERLKNIDQALPAMAGYEDGAEEKILEWFHNNGIYLDGPDYWPSDDEMLLACWHLGYVDEYYIDEWEEWLDAHPEEKQKFQSYLHALAHENHGVLF